MRLRLAFLLAGLVIAGGCSSGPLVRDAPGGGEAAGYPNHSVGQIVDLLAGAAAPDVYRSGAKIEVRRGDRTDNASLTLHARGDSVSAVVRGPFGIEVGRALATADSVYLYDGLKGRVLYGPADAAAPFVPGFDTPSGAALRGAVLGEAAAIPPYATLLGSGAALPSRSPVAPFYTLTATEPDGSRRFWSVDAVLWRVTEYRVARGEVTELVQTFSAFDTVDGRVVPRRVVLARPADGLSVEIEHRDLQIAAGASPSFRVPASAPRTRFD